mgnify:CR=1 FL=1
MPISYAIEVEVQTAFIAEQSNEREQRFVFSYTITVKNNGQHAVKLLSRYWLITDANGDKSTVVGDGVIGKQPTISPGHAFQYSSGCILKTPVGTMQGHYQMIDEQENKTIQVEIPVFGLALPNILN